MALPRQHALDSAAAAGLGPPSRMRHRATSQLMTSQWKPTTTTINQYL